MSPEAEDWLWGEVPSSLPFLHRRRRVASASGETTGGESGPGQVIRWGLAPEAQEVPRVPRLGQGRRVAEHWRAAAGLLGVQYAKANLGESESEDDARPAPALLVRRHRDFQSIMERGSRVAWEPAVSNKSTIGDEEASGREVSGGGGPTAKCCQAPPRDDARKEPRRQDEPRRRAGRSSAEAARAVTAVCRRAAHNPLSTAARPRPNSPSFSSPPPRVDSRPSSAPSLLDSQHRDPAPLQSAKRSSRIASPPRPLLFPFSSPPHHRNRTNSFPPG